MKSGNGIGNIPVLFYGDNEIELFFLPFLSIIIGKLVVNA
jgi:hypothetical protein